MQPLQTVEVTIHVDDDRQDDKKYSRRVVTKHGSYRDQLGQPV